MFIFREWKLATETNTVFVNMFILTVKLAILILGQWTLTCCLRQPPRMHFPPRETFAMQIFEII